MYSKQAFSRLALLHIVLPIIFLLIGMRVSELFIMIAPFLFLGAVIPLITISLQNLKSVRFGHMIWLNIIVEFELGRIVFQVLWSLFDRQAFRTFEDYFPFIAVAFLVVTLFAHTYIASTVFAWSNNRRIFSSIIGTMILIIFIVASSASSWNIID